MIAADQYWHVEYPDWGMGWFGGIAHHTADQCVKA